MFTAQTLSPEHIDQGKSAKSIPARFMLPDQSENECLVTNLSITGATFLSPKMPHIGVPVVAYIGELGRIEASVGPATEGGFTVTFSCTGPRLERLQQRVKALIDAGPATGIAARRHLRIEPTEKQSQIMLPDGRAYPCEVIDISVASAAIKTDVMPGLGTFLMLGRMKGRVIRYLENGVVIEFVKYLDAHQFHHVHEELRP